MVGVAVEAGGGELEALDADGADVYGFEAELALDLGEAAGGVPAGEGELNHVVEVHAVEGEFELHFEVLAGGEELFETEFVGVAEFGIEVGVGEDVDGAYVGTGEGFGHGGEPEALAPGGVEVGIGCGLVVGSEAKDGPCLGPVVEEEFFIAGTGTEVESAEAIVGLDVGGQVTAGVAAYEELAVAHCPEAEESCGDFPTGVGKPLCLVLQEIGLAGIVEYGAVVAGLIVDGEEAGVDFVAEDAGGAKLMEGEPGVDVVGKAGIGSDAAVQGDEGLVFAVPDEGAGTTAVGDVSVEAVVQVAAAVEVGFEEESSAVVGGAPLVAFVPLAER